MRKVVISRSNCQVIVVVALECFYSAVVAVVVVVAAVDVVFVIKNCKTLNLFVIVDVLCVDYHTTRVLKKI